MRKTLWQHTLTQVETADIERLDENTIPCELAQYRDSLKSRVDDGGNPMLRGNHIQGKLMSKIANLLYRELKRSLVKFT